MQTLSVKLLSSATGTFRTSCRMYAVPMKPSSLPRKRSIDEMEDDQDYRPRGPLSDIEDRIDESKRKLKWRVPFIENKATWYSKLNVFAPERQSMDLVLLLAKPIKWSWKEFQADRMKRRFKTEAFLQQFIVERHKILGNDLAAAHFIIHRGGSAK